MSDYQSLMATIQRERITEEKVRAMDAAEIVEWVHKLEDQIEELELTVENLNYECVALDEQLHD